MPKVALTLVCAVMLVAPAWGDLKGTTVSLVAPTYPLDPATTYTYVFYVERDWSSAEYLEEIHFDFPIGLVPQSGTMGYDVIWSGHPNFTMSVGFGNTRATWHASGSVNSTLHMGESINVWVNVRTSDSLPPGAWNTIHWWLGGSWSSEKDGEFVVHTPVERTSWGAIKAMYGRAGQTAG